MKRKLSVAISLVGDSKVVMLDEPTAGMDPYSRRATWDLLLKHKKGRTMLLTTHFMDEADLLGDRIAIVHSGKLKTVGSSLYLKSKYGIGYHMNVVKKPGCDPNQIAEMIKRHIPEAELVSDVAAEATFILPKSSSPQFGSMLKELEAQKECLMFQSYGVSVTTMEEVFLKVGELEDEKLMESSDTIGEDKVSNMKKNNEKYGIENDISASDDDFNMKNSPLHSGVLKLKTGSALRNQQFRAMFSKRWHHSKRDWKALIAQVLMPALFALLAMLVANSASDDYRTYDKLDMNLAMFHKYDYTSVYTVVPDSAEAAYGPNIERYFSDNADKTYGKIEQVTTGSDAFVQKLLDLQNFNNPVDSYASMAYNETGFFAYYNNHKAAQSSPVALNWAANAKLQALLNDPNTDIRTTNWPLPTQSSDISKNIAASGTYLGVALNLVFGLGIAVSYYVLFLIHERVSSAKHMQFISGVNVSSYWTGTFAWDFVCYIVPTVFIGIILLAFNYGAYTGSNFVPSIILILLFGWASVPLMYCFTFKFQTPSTGFVVMVTLNIILGLGTLITTSVLDGIGSSGSTTKNVSDILQWVFQVIPMYAMAEGFIQMGYQYALSQNGVSAKSAWELEVTLRGMIFMAVEGFLFFFILYLIEKNKYSFGALKADHQVVSKNRDEDVIAEEARVAHGGADEELVKVKNLGKVYKSKTGNGADFTAVRNLTFGVPSGECFGLLGVNGAGKTTTFKMLTGDHPASCGDAYIDGYNISNEMEHARQRIGYCPQFDALIETLTGEELLSMYARMRGVHEKDLKRIVSSTIEHMGLSECCMRVCGSYSGGNKRKLSTAVAIVGDPPVVFLDEPTTGMDPKARRFVWNAIAKVFREGRCVVLTSHSMEECEALCTRIAIMVNGEFKCIGSPQHLRSKYGHGYNLMAKIGTHDTGPFKSFIKEHFPSAQVKEEHFGMVQFELDKSEVSLPSMFDALEKIKNELNVVDYSIAQTTLEQVFISFAEEQHNKEDIFDIVPEVKQSVGLRIACGVCTYGLSEIYFYHKRKQARDLRAHQEQHQRELDQFGQSSVQAPNVTQA